MNDELTLEDFRPLPGDYEWIGDVEVDGEWVEVFVEVEEPWLNSA